MTEPRHFLDLPDANIVKTHDFALTNYAIDLLASDLAMGAVVGDAGLGKTFAVSSATVNQKAIDVISLDCGVGWSSRNIVQELLVAISGIREEGDRLVLTAELADILAGKPRLIVLDEAQRLTHASIETVRSLHDREETKFGVVFVGGARCWEVLSRYPMLYSRIYVDVHFRRLANEDVIRDIPSYHPIYKGVGPELLLLVNDKFAHGVFRNWATFTKQATRLCRESGIKTLTEQVARNVFALHGGRRRAA